MGRGSHCKELSSLLRDNSYRHRLHTVFSDFVELAALSISNAVDRTQYDAREARYMQIVGSYTPEEVQRFPRMLAVLVDWLEQGFADCLGELFMTLELGNHWKGQFFTPYPICTLMAGLTLGDARAEVERSGFVTVSDPASGAGAMLLAMAEAIQEQGINYQRAMHATAVDVDATAVHMSYVQLSLTNCPALVVHGNSLTLKEWGHWATPAHILGGWDRRLRGRAQPREVDQLAEVPAALAVPVVSVPSVSEIRAAVVAKRERDQLSLFG